jgi:hypothetical protein
LVGLEGEAGCQRAGSAITHALLPRENEWVRVPNEPVSWKITGVEVVPAIADHTAPAGRAYVVVRSTFRNETNNPVSMDDIGSVALMDSNLRQTGADIVLTEVLVRAANSRGVDPPFAPHAEVVWPAWVFDVPSSTVSGLEAMVLPRGRGAVQALRVRISAQQRPAIVAVALPQENEWVRVASAPVSWKITGVEVVPAIADHTAPAGHAYVVVRSMFRNETNNPTTDIGGIALLGLDPDPIVPSRELTGALRLATNMPAVDAPFAPHGEIPLSWVFDVPASAMAGLSAVIMARGVRNEEPAIQRVRISAQQRPAIIAAAQAPAPPAVADQGAGGGAAAPTTALDPSAGDGGGAAP